MTFTLPSPIGKILVSDTVEEQRETLKEKTAVEQASSCQAQSVWLGPPVFHIFAMESPLLDPPLRRIFIVVALLVVFVSVVPADRVMQGSLLCLVLYDCRGMQAVFACHCSGGAH